MPKSYRPKISPLQFVQQIYPLFFVLLMALALRLYFAIGVNGFDSLLYADSAWQLAHGQWPFDLTTGARRIGFYLPLAILYSIFGAGEPVTLAWTMGASLITICLIYAIGSMLGGRGAGLIAAFLWAINPFDIIAATTGLPDGPMAMFATGAVWFYLLGKNNRLRKVYAYAASAFCVIYGFWVKELILFVGLFLLLWETVVHFFPTQKKALAFLRQSKVNPGVIVAIVFLVLIIYGSMQKFSFPEALATTANDFYLAAFFHQLQVVFIPVSLGAIFIAIYKRWEGSYFLIVWFVVTAFIYEWAPITFSLSFYTPNTIFTSPRNILFLLPPLVLIGGYALNKVIHPNTVNTSIFVPALAITTLILGLQTGVLSYQVVVTIAVIALLASIPIYILLLLLKRPNKSTWVTATPALLLFMLGFSIISPLGNVWGGGAAQVLELRNLKEAVEFSQNNPDYGIYFFSDEDPRFIRLFAFFSGYKFSEDETGASRIGLVHPSENVDANAFVVDVLGSHKEDVYPTWWLVEEIQQPATLYVSHPATLEIYRVVEPITAENRLNQLQTELTQAPNDPGKLSEVLGAAVNANKPYDALNTYLALRELGYGDLELEQKVANVINLFLQDHPEYEEIPSLMLNGDFSNGLDEWEISEAEEAGVQLELISGRPIALRLSNPTDIDIIPISQHLQLKPNTAYVFEATAVVKVGDVALLYWWVEGKEGYLSANRDLPAGSRYRHIFITPDWPSSQDFLLAPVFFFGAGSVQIGDVRFYEFLLPGN